jgi:hypothetical protein
VAQGNPLIQAQQQAVQWIGQQLQTQASFLAYMEALCPTRTLLALQRWAWSRESNTIVPRGLFWQCVSRSRWGQCHDRT